MENIFRSFIKDINILAIFILLTIFLAGCGSSPTDLPLVVVYGENPGSDETLTSTILGTEQRKGYEEGLLISDESYNSVYLDERTPQSDFQRTFRDLVENSKQPLVSIIGATSNSGTSHAAALVNFFNIPMVIPSANGDVLFPSDNLWAFRLSATGSAYAGFFFENIVDKNSVDAILTDPTGAFVIPPVLKIAIVYEKDTFGESAAVATANAALGQSLNIGLYKSLDPKNIDPAGLSTVANLIKESNSQLVYMVLSDPVLSKNMVQAIKNVYPVKFLPLLVGQAGGFSSQEFLSSVEANGVYVLQQAIIPTMCPDSVSSNYDAQSYAAIYLLDQSLKQSNGVLEKSRNWWQRLFNVETTIIQKREALRDALKQTNFEIPCMGSVSFDNTGQNKMLNLELIQVNNRITSKTDSPTFLDALEARLAMDQLK